MDYIKPPYKNKLGIPVVDHFNIDDYYISDIDKKSKGFIINDYYKIDIYIDRGITSIKCRLLDRFRATGIYIEKYDTSTFKSFYIKFKTLIKQILPK